MHFLHSLSYLCISLTLVYSSNAIDTTPVESNLNFNNHCPAAEDIKPCVCIIKYGNINLDCSGVTSNQQLKYIFHNAHFPVPSFREFYMDGNKGITVLEKEAFGNITFTMIFVMRSALQKVEVGALDASKETVELIDLLSNSITTFPFQTLDEFSALEELRLSDNQLSAMPVIESKTLKMLDLSMNPLMKIPADSLRSMASIEFIALTFANISYIPPGLFKNVSSLQYVLLGYNSITSLPTDVITCSSPGVLHCGNNWLTSVSLDHNPIAEVQQNAFEGHPGLRVDITGTALTSLNETVWRPLIEANVTLSLEDTPLACSCDMAWLAIDPPSLAHVFGDCSNGTPLQHLDPKDFANCTLTI